MLVNQTILFSDFTARYETDILVLKKPATQSSLRCHIKRLNEAFGHRSLRDLSYPVLQPFFTASAVNLRPKSTQNLWATLRLLLNQARREGLVKEVPEITLPRVSKARQRWLTVEEMRAILRKAPAGDQAFYWLLCETGLRIGEVFGLRAEDLNAEDQTLTICRSAFNRELQDPKTDSSHRTICISQHLTELLTTKAPSGLFFTNNGSPMSMSTMLGRLHRLLVLAKVPRCGFHAFRHGNRTLCAQIGMPDAVAETRLGHALRGMTGVYLHTVQFADRDWADKIAWSLV